MKLYRNTEMKRATLVQEARVILAADETAPAGSYRRVQILVPASPSMYLGIDMHPQQGFSDNGIGPNRTYKVPPLTPGQTIVVRLLPKQALMAMSEESLCFTSLIIEHIEGGDDA